MKSIRNTIKFHSMAANLPHKSLSPPATSFTSKTKVGMGENKIISIANYL